MPPANRESREPGVRSARLPGNVELTLDGFHPTTTHPTESSIAAAWIMRHFGLTPRHASLVATLAGLEGGAP